jgi:spore coat protein CotF
MPSTETTDAGDKAFISTFYPAEHRDQIAKVAAEQGRSTTAQIRFILKQWCEKASNGT